MKRLFWSLRIAIRALKVNKLRSALTMLGIVIGVAAVIATAAIGSGAKRRIEEQIASIGSNVIIVLPGSLTSSGLRMGTGNAITLSESDARELSLQCPDIALAVPAVRGGAQVVYGNSNWATIITGTTPGYLEVRELSVAEGAPFTQQDVDGADKVALVGRTVVNNLFGDTDPVGQSIRIKNVPFVVVGVLSPKGQSPTGQDQDDIILILPRGRLALRTQYANDNERHVLDADGLPDRVRVPKQVIHNGSAHESDLVGAVDILLRKWCPFGHRKLAHL